MEVTILETTYVADFDFDVTRQMIDNFRAVTMRRYH